MIRAGGTGLVGAFSGLIRRTRPLAVRGAETAGCAGRAFCVLGSVVLIAMLLCDRALAAEPTSCDPGGDAGFDARLEQAKCEDRAGHIVGALRAALPALHAAMDADDLEDIVRATALVNELMPRVARMRFSPVPQDVSNVQAFIDGRPCFIEKQPEQGFSMDPGNRRGVIHTVRSVLVERDSSLEVLPDVKAAALVVSGKEDTLLPTIHSRRIAEKLPRARRVEVAGAAHLTPLEQPEVSNKLILDFVRDLSTR